MLLRSGTSGTAMVRLETSGSPICLTMFNLQNEGIKPADEMFFFGIE
jgi:hypothetical protein